jgi:hypothetical protein
MLRDAILRRWYRMLALPRQPPTWYRAGLQEEEQELEEANTFIDKLSESSDVYFVLVRAQYDGFPIKKLPPLSVRDLPIYGYMMAKLTSRWAFYQTADVLSGAGYRVREVVDPKKEYKLEQVASRHHIEPMTFKRVARRLRRVWPLLP